MQIASSYCRSRLSDTLAYDWLITNTGFIAVNFRNFAGISHKFKALRCYFIPSSCIAQKLTGDFSLPTRECISIASVKCKDSQDDTSSKDLYRP